MRTPPACDDRARKLGGWSSDRFRSGFVRGVAVALMALSPVLLAAAELGPLRLNSWLGEVLDAEVSVFGDGGEPFTPSIALEPDQVGWERGRPRPSEIRVTVDPARDGRATVLRITSLVPVTRTVLDLTIRIDNASFSESVRYVVPIGPPSSWSGSGTVLGRRQFRLGPTLTQPASPPPPAVVSGSATPAGAGSEAPVDPLAPLIVRQLAQDGKAEVGPPGPPPIQPALPDRVSAALLGPPRLSSERPASEPWPQEIEIRQGDTLQALARRFARPDLTVEQVMWALYDENRSAFQGSIHQLLTGARLRMPTIDSVRRWSPAEARLLVKRETDLADLAASRASRELASPPVTAVAVSEPASTASVPVPVSAAPAPAPAAAPLSVPAPAPSAEPAVAVIPSVPAPAPAVPPVTADQPVSAPPVAESLPAPLPDADPAPAPILPAPVPASPGSSPAPAVATADLPAIAPAAAPAAAPASADPPPAAAPAVAPAAPEAAPSVAVPAAADPSAPLPSEQVIEQRIRDEVQAAVDKLRHEQRALTEALEKSLAALGAKLKQQSPQAEATEVARPAAVEPPSPPTWQQRVFGPLPPPFDHPFAPFALLIAAVLMLSLIWIALLPRRRARSPASVETPPPRRRRDPEFDDLLVPSSASAGPVGDPRPAAEVTSASSLEQSIGGRFELPSLDLDQPARSSEATLRGLPDAGVVRPTPRGSAPAVATLSARDPATASAVSSGLATVVRQQIDARLELAAAYVDLGDGPRARQLLAQTLIDGDEGQRLSAQRLLNRLTQDR